MLKTRILTAAILISMSSAVLTPATAAETHPASRADQMQKSQEKAFRQGLDAYYAKKYHEAMRIWLGPARAGNAKAQSSIGHLYFEGLGHPQNDQRALAWYGMSAAQGEPTAQYRMGMIYLRGKAVTRNPEDAYMWCNLAMNAGYPEAFYCREDAANELTQSEIERAERRGRRLTVGPNS